MRIARENLYHIFLLGMFLGWLAWSGVEPYDRLTWFLEVVPAIVAAVILVAVYPRFRFTNLVYTLILMHAVVLLVGGHYTYSEMPWFNWLRDTYGLSRNYYDRVGHVFQGFVPALVSREILLRKSPLQRGKWLFFIVVCVVVAISAFYEILEWWVAAASGEAATAFLATQGDVWDTQWDMFLALLGGMGALVAMSRWHDRELVRLQAKAVSRP
jgi:putative membrane protein